MGDNVEQHGKLLNFLMAEWARKDNRQLTEVDLLFSPGQGFRDEEIRKWVRADEPEFFAEYGNVEKLATLIIEIAAGEADAKPAGRHRFVVRTKQHLGQHAHHSLVFFPSYTGSSDETAITTGGGGGGSRGADVAVAQILANNNGQLMRTNTQMFDGTIRVLGQQNLSMHEQIMVLTTETATLRRELEEARSNKMDREFQIAMAAEKNARMNAGFQKALQLGSVVIAKIGAGNAGAQLGEGAPLPMLIGDFYQSLRADQMNTLMQALDMAQKIMFMEIVNLVRPPQQQNDSKPAGQAAGGAPR